MPPENAPPSKPRPPAAPAPPAAAVPGAPLLVEQAITLLEHAKRMEPTDPQATLAAVRRVDDWLRAIVTTDNAHAAFGRRDGEWLSRYGVNLSVADSICHFVKSDMSVLAERTQIRLPNGGLWGKNIPDCVRLVSTCAF